MHEVAFEDLIHGQVVLAFDGRVVECFKQGLGSISRIHVRQLLCEATGPTRKGHYEVKFSIAPSGGGFGITVASDTWRSLQPLIAEIYAVNR